MAVSDNHEAYISLQMGKAGMPYFVKQGLCVACKLFFCVCVPSSTLQVSLPVLNDFSVYFH